MPAPSTPDRLTDHCSACGALQEPANSAAGGDAVCPGCGCLLVRSRAVAEDVRSIIAGLLDVEPKEIEGEAKFRYMTGDSLTTLEFVMDMEMAIEKGWPEACSAISKEEMQRAESLQDLVRLLASRHEPT